MLDILLIGFILLNVYIGRNKGLIRMVLELSSILIAYFAASRLGPFVGSTILGALGLETLAESIVVQTAVEGGVNPILSFMNSVGAVIVFFIVRYGLSFLLFTTSVFNKIPVIGSFNKVGGTAIGLVKGVVLSVLLVWILSFMAIPTIQNSLESSLIATQLEDIFPRMYNRLHDIIGQV
ncbi:CvpA family protein [Proteinivorax hydrogeniformans]|uniref:CvpA family protein n=1 Tax=Proteinivorax hydrogeniformans TaxID=1826727 RepID=A0AAU8HSH1_9FIRM